MKILSLVTEAYGGMGGIAQANRDLFEALAQNGWEVVILPRRSQDILTSPPENVKQEKAVLNPWLYGLGAIQNMLNEKYDLIYCGHLFMAPLAFFLGVLFGKSYWLHLYGIEAWTKPSLLVQKTVRSARLVTAISRHTRRKFLSWAMIDSVKVKVLPCTFDSCFEPGPKPNRLIEKYNLNKKEVLLTLGRLSSKERYKGHDRVIAALPRVLKNHPDAVYIVAGEGDDKSRLKILASKTGVEKSVLFIGSVPCQELPELYRMSDVFVMPSTGEGFGIVFLEATASGLPVIGCDKDGSFDAMREGRSGYILKEDADLPQLIHKVLKKELPKKEGAHFFSKQVFNVHVARLLHDFAETDMNPAKA